MTKNRPFWPPFLNGFFFFKSCFSNVNICSNLSQILLKNSFGKELFQILVT